MIKAYWTRIVLFAAGGALIALLASNWMPKKYQAEVQVMVDQSAPGVPMIASPQEGSIIDLKEFSRPRNIVTQVQQLQSLGVLSTAAKKVADNNGWPDPNQNPNSELNPVNLQNELSISADQNSDIIDYQLRMTAEYPVKDVAQEIYLAFVDQNRENSRRLAGQAIASLAAQSNNINSQLKEIDVKTSALRQRTGFPDVAAAITSDIQALALVKQTRDTAASDAAGAHQTVAVLTTELAKTPQVVAQSTTTATNPIWEKLQSDLITAESERAGLMATYLPGNSLVNAADEKIRSIKTALKNLQHSVPASASTGPNQAYQALEAQLSTSKAAAEAADQKLAVANQAVGERERYLQTLPPIQMQLASLLRQQQALEKVYSGYQDELKTLQAAKEGRTSPARELGEPTVLPTPVSPKPVINAIFGVLVGLLLGIASMQFAEAKRQPIRSLAQLNGLALTPAYRIIPELREPFRGLHKAPPEPFESLLLNYMRSEKRPYRVVVVGINKDSGASITALNLAIAGARHGSSVLLVECDPKGALARAGFKSAPKVGEVVELTPSVRVTSAVTVFDVDAHHGGVASSIASKETDITIIDLEPTTRSAEYAFIAPYVDEVILLVRAGRARSVEFLQAQQALRDAGCKRVTVVLTRSSDFSVVVDAVDVEIDANELRAVPVAVLASSQPAVTEAPAFPTSRTEQTAKPITAEEILSPRPEAVESSARRPIDAVSEQELEQLLAVTPEPESGSQPPQPAAGAPEPREIKATNGVSEEKPAKRARSAPHVSVEDFGGIARARKPEASASHARRAKIDTTGIDS